MPSILFFKILVQRTCLQTVSNACLKSMKTRKNFLYLFNANLLRNSMTNILSVVQQAFLNPVCTSLSPVCTSLINLINSYSSAKVFSQISLDSIHYDRISDASSDDTIESACITIALCNKDYNWRIFKEPPISQTHC